MPDGEFLEPWELNAAEISIQEKIMSAYKDRSVIIGRCAHLKKPGPIHLEQGRGQCQARALCNRGCPFGGYYSSNASTLPWAEKTGNLALRPGSVVHSIIYDEHKGKATGVRVIDADTKRATEYFARIIFLNAGCLNTNLILLNSHSRRFPNGLGNDNGLLGKFIAFHDLRGNIRASYDGDLDFVTYGRRPTKAIMPNFRNVYKQETDFLRGYMVNWSASRIGWNKGSEILGIGAEFKDRLAEPGPWRIKMAMQGETIPHERNHVRLSPDKTDDWGIPLLITSVGYSDNDNKILQDFTQQGSEMLERAGCKHIKALDNHGVPGSDIHEMGGVRMGKDPKTSLLNKWNQLHDCQNVFVTDGACMTSTGNQNPSLTYMALTARAASHAVEELRKRNL